MIRLLQCFARSGRNAETPSLMILYLHHEHSFVFGLGLSEIFNGCSCCDHFAACATGTWNIVFELEGFQTKQALC